MKLSERQRDLADAVANGRTLNDMFWHLFGRAVELHKNVGSGELPLSEVACLIAVSEVLSPPEKQEKTEKMQVEELV